MRKSIPLYFPLRLASSNSPSTKWTPSSFNYPTGVHSFSSTEKLQRAAQAKKHFGIFYNCISDLAVVGNICFSALIVCSTHIRALEWRELFFSLLSSSIGNLKENHHITPCRTSCITYNEWTKSLVINNVGLLNQHLLSLNSLQKATVAPYWDIVACFRYACYAVNNWTMCFAQYLIIGAVISVKYVKNKSVNFLWKYALVHLKYTMHIIWLLIHDVILVKHSKVRMQIQILQIKH